MIVLFGQFRHRPFSDLWLILLVSTFLFADHWPLRRVLALNLDHHLRDPPPPGVLNFSSVSAHLGPLPAAPPHHAPSSPAPDHPPTPISVPVAFPIFRPPMISAIHHHRSSSVEHGKLPDNFRPQSLTNNSTGDLASASGSSSDLVEEDSAAEELRPVKDPKPPKNGQIGDPNPNNNASRRAEASGMSTQRMHKLGTKEPPGATNSFTRHGGQITAATPTPNPFHQQQHEHSPAAPIHFHHHPSSSSSATTIATPSITNVPSIVMGGRSTASSSTPQFPVFTGMGMEIIESNESEESSSSGSNTSSGSSMNTDGMIDQRNRETEEEAERRKMHYERAEKKQKQGQNEEMKMNSTKGKEEEEGERPTIIHGQPIIANGDRAGGGGGMAGITTEKPSATKIMEEWRNGSVTGESQRGQGERGNWTSTTTSSLTDEEVTEDLLAMFATRSPQQAQPKKVEEEANNGEGKGMIKQESEEEEEGESEEEKGRNPGKGPKLPTKGPGEEVIPRPTTTAMPEGNWLGQSKSNITLRTTTSSDITDEVETTPAQITTTLGGHKGSTRYPFYPRTTTTTVTSPSSTETTTATTETVPSTTSTTRFGGDNDGRTTTPKGAEAGDGEGWVDRRITVGPGHGREGQKKASTGDWFNNGIEEEEEGEGQEEEPGEGRRTTTTEESSRTTTMPSSTRRQPSGERFRGRGGEQHTPPVGADGGPPSTRMPSHSESESSNTANFRLAIMASIIAVLFVAVGIGSICTGRYMRKSRQLHGKYRPAAYEMQTTRPAPFSYPSNMALNGAGDHQQMAHGAVRYSNQHLAPTEYSTHHLHHHGEPGSPPPHHLFVPASGNADGGASSREERLI